MIRLIFLGLALLSLPAKAQTDTTLISSDTLRTLNSTGTMSQFAKVDSVVSANLNTNGSYTMSDISTQLAVTGNYSSINGLEKYSLLTSAGTSVNLGEPYTVPVLVTYAFSKVNGVLQQREINAISTPTFKPLHGKIRYYADAEFEKSYSRSINNRYSVGFGTGYMLYGKNKQGDDKSEVVLTTFLLYENTNIFVRGVDNPIYISAYRISTRLKWRIFLLDKNRFSITGLALYAPRFNAPGVYKLAENIVLNYKLWQGLSMLISYDYLSEQLLVDGTRKISTIASVGLSFKL